MYYGISWGNPCKIWVYTRFILQLGESTQVIKFILEISISQDKQITF